MKRSLNFLALSVVASVVILGCGGGVSRVNCQTSPNNINCQVSPTQPTPTPAPAPQGVSCTAVPSKSAVNSGENFTVNVTASNAKAPYSIPSQVVSFASTTSISAQLSNSGSSAQVVAQTVTVLDSAGKSGSCNYSVTVNPLGSGGAACTIANNPESISIGQTVTFTVAATGVANPTFGYLDIQTGWSVPLTSQSATQAQVQVIFSNPGARTVMAKLTANGSQVSCSKNISVLGSALTVQLTPSGSTFPISQIITAKAIMSGWYPGLPISYSFTSSDPGIGIQTYGNSAQVRVIDGYSHQFDLVVLVSNSIGVLDQQSVRITFSNSSGLNCEIQSGAMAQDGSIPFWVRVVGTGEMLVIDSFDTGPNAIQVGSGLSNPISLRFYGSGYQTVTARAHSYSGQQCFNGNSFSKTIVLGGGVGLNRCDVVMSPNPSVAGSYVNAQVSVPAGTGSGAFRYELFATGGIASANSGPGFYRVYYGNAGSYSVTARVTDLYTGVSVSCSTNQTVNSVYQVRYIDCGSVNYQYHECSTGNYFIQSLVLYQQYSAAACFSGYSFGAIQPNRIWVNYGCRAKFEVLMKTN